MKNLSDNASKLGDISSASDATNEYVENLKGATQKVGELVVRMKKLLLKYLKKQVFWRCLFEGSYFY